VAAHDAITMSVMRNEIVHVSSCNVDEDTILSECDGYSEDAQERDYWGKSSAGYEWRVIVSD
jgi:hypothetical protein